MKQVIQQRFLTQQIHDPLRHIPAVPQRQQITLRQIPILTGISSIAHPGCQHPELGHGQGFALRIAKAAGQQQEASFRRSQRNRFLMGAGALTSSSVSTPSSPRSIGLMA